VKVSHRPAGLFAAFDDADLIAHAGLVPMIRLAERCGLAAVVAAKVKLTGAKNGAGTTVGAKVMSIAGGMEAGANSIDDLDVLRHGGLARLFGGLRAPSTLARSCARSPGGTCANWSPRQGRSPAIWPRTPAWSPPGTRWRSCGQVKRLNAKIVPAGQAELFAVWRHHVIFTDSPFVLAQAETMHREHAQVEQVFADLEDPAFAHLPSGTFTENAAWLTLAATAHNLTRAAGHLASA
jgi:hypothetical protein